MTTTLHPRPTAIAVDTVLRDGRRGTLAACSDKWHSFWTTMDGSAERDLHEHMKRVDKERYESVSPQYASLMESLNQEIAAFSSLGSKISRNYIRGHGIYLPSIETTPTFAKKAVQIDNAYVESVEFHFDTHLLDNCESAACYCAVTSFPPCSSCESCDSCPECDAQWSTDVAGLDFTGVSIVEDSEGRYIAIGTQDSSVAVKALLACLTVEEEYIIALEDRSFLAPEPVWIKDDWGERYIYEDIVSDLTATDIPGVLIPQLP